MEPRHCVWAEWVWQGFAEVFGSLAGWAPLGVLLAAVTVIGFSMRVRDQLSAVDWWRPLVPVLALACGAVVFQLILAIGRVAVPFVGGVEDARSSRYVYIVAALILPLIAVAVSHLIHRWKFVVIALFPLSIIGLVDNVRHLILIDTVPTFNRASQMNTRILVSDAAYSELIELGPAESELRLPFIPLTAGWLRTVKAEARLPEVGGVTPSRAALAEAHLAARLVLAKNVECHESIEPGVMHDFVAGDILRITAKSFDSRISLIYESADGTRVQPPPGSIWFFNAVHVGAPHARLMFPVDEKVEKIERCTAKSVDLQ